MRRLACAALAVLALASTAACQGKSSGMTPEQRLDQQRSAVTMTMTPRQ